MDQETRKDHWNRIYSSKKSGEMSWSQENPATSLSFIHNFNLPKKASIIDVGGGDSLLVDKLMAEGYEDITVLDISEQALQKAKKRLGDKTGQVSWVVADITEFSTDKKFDLWHDRATFHFMTTPGQIRKYLDRVAENLKGDGFLTIGTFSETGPKECSGLKIKQYSEQTLQEQLSNGFEKIRCVHEDHRTPSGAIQNFIFCGFRKLRTPRPSESPLRT